MDFQRMFNHSSSRRQLDEALAFESVRLSRFRDTAANGVYLYGAGFVCSWTLDYCQKNSIPVLGIADSDPRKWGTAYSGFEVLRPGELLELAPSAVLVTAKHHGRTIEKFLIDSGIEVACVDALVVHQYCQTSIVEIEEVLAHDPRSLETLHAVLATAILGRRSELRKVVEPHPYFSEFDFFNRLSEIYIDAGAYVGDTVERFLFSVNGVFDSVHAFEPVQSSFSAMERRIRRLKREWNLTRGKFHLNRVALSDCSGSVSLEHSSFKTQSSLMKVGKGSLEKRTIVPTVDLDSYLDGAPCTLIKVDVEGSERDLLRGASKTIVRHCPRIALSAYHFPSDVFELPRLVRSITDQYEVTLRHHSSQMLETVFYFRHWDD